MRVSLYSLLLVAHALGQGIVPNAWLCDWIGIEGASPKLKEKYRNLISNLNKDTTLKAQQERVTNWIKANAADLPELKKRALMTAEDKVMIPNLMAPKVAPDSYDFQRDNSKSRAMASSAVADPAFADKQVVDNTIYNAKFWLKMRARDVALIDDTLDRIEKKVNEAKMEEVEKLFWAQDRKFRNFYRPHHDTIKQLVLERITNDDRRNAIRKQMELAEAVDDQAEEGHDLLPLMEPMAAEFFPGCGL